jgi:hypothetical protein
MTELKGKNELKQVGVSPLIKITAQVAEVGLPKCMVNSIISVSNAEDEASSNDHRMKECFKLYVKSRILSKNMMNIPRAKHCCWMMAAALNYDIVEENTFIKMWNDLICLDL